MARYEKLELRFGKYNGKTVSEVYNIDIDYLCWLAAESFSYFVKNAASVFLADKQAEQSKLSNERERVQKAAWRAAFFAANNITYAAPEPRGMYTVSIYVQPQHSLNVPGAASSQQRKYGIKLARMYRGTHAEFGGLKKATATEVAQKNAAAGYSTHLWKGDIYDGEEVDF